MQVVGIDVIELIQKVRSRLVLREEQNVYADINGVAYGICYNTISLGRIYSKIKEALPPHSRPIQRSINSDMPRVIQRFRKLYEEYTGAVVDQMKWED
jgi:biotin synthase-related radical SAM superfamily protein